mgnify:CR=1 FL=1
MEERRWLPEVIVQLMDRVEARLDEAWTLDGMADEARFSSFHFHRMFRRAVGETPAAFLERIRLERAALLLLAREEPITDLALDVGFRRPETFARRFRAHFGVSARDYRSRQLALWADLGLEAGRDPLGAPGEIQVVELPEALVEVRRSLGEDEGFVLDANRPPWRDEPLLAGRLFGSTLDWPGLTPPGSVRQDWARPLDERPVAEGWVRRRLGGGLHATLAAPPPGPVDPTVYQRLFVWSMAGRHRLRPGPVVEIRDGDSLTVHQPVADVFAGSESGSDRSSHADTSRS